MSIRSPETMISSKQRALPFGFIADVLFQIIVSGDASTLLTLCLLNRSTYDTIKSLEPHICRWFMRLHGIETFDSVLSLNSRTGRQNTLTVHSLVRSLYRHGLARRLASHIVPAVWGPFYDDDKVEMNFEAELKLARRLERGLHIVFHMADISRDTKRERDRTSRTSLSSRQAAKIGRLLDKYSDFPLMNDTSPSQPSPKTKKHLSKTIKWGATEYEVGKRRLHFRSNHLDKSSEVDFHCTLRMLRELLERMLLRHGPKFWHRDTRNEYSVVSWFLLNQTPRNLSKLLLTPQDECCHYEAHCVGVDSTDSRNCLFSNPLDEYWDAWNDTPLPGLSLTNPNPNPISNPIISSLKGQLPTPIPIPSSGLNSIQNSTSNQHLSTNPDCPCASPRLIRSWSVKPTLFDHRGREYNRAAERYLKEMWSQRHVGLHQAFAMGVFAAVL